MRLRSSVALSLAAWTALASGLAAVEQADVGPDIAGTVQRALDLLQQGEREEAEALLQEVVQTAPRHGAANFQLGRLALARGELELARDHLEIATTETTQRTYLAWSLLGRAELGLGEPEAALEAFDHCLSTAPRFGPALVGRARAALFLGRVEPALSDLASALELPGVEAATVLLAAEVLLFTDQGDEALRLLNTLTGNPRVPGALTAAAEMLTLAVAPGPEADRLLRIQVGRHLSSAHAYFALGVRRLPVDEASALESLRVALTVDDTEPVPLLYVRRIEPTEALPPPTRHLDTRFATARRLYEEERFEEAGRVAGRLLEERPRHVAAQLIVLRAAEARGDLWTALSGYRQLTERLPDLPALESRLADVAHAMGAEELAEAAVRSALEAFPDDGVLHYRLATVLAARGDSAAAIDEVVRATELGFDPPQAWLTLGQLYLEQMQMSPAIEAFSRALEVDPDAAEFLGTFAMSSLTTEEFARLRELLEDHAAAHPGNSDTQYSLGVMTLRDGRLDEAVAYLERAATLSPERSQIHYNLGQALLRLGREKEARQVMDRFTELKAREDQEWEAQNRLHFLRVDAADAEAAGEPARALTIWREINEDTRATPDDQLALADSLLASGAPEAALDWYKIALRAKPYHPDLLASLARAADAVGDTELARLARSRAALLSMSGGS